MCGKKETDLKGVEIVENSDIPRFSNPILRFQEELTLSNDSWVDVSFLVDNEGAVYIFDIQREYIMGYKYDTRGKLIFSKKFPRGQGPGDIFNPFPLDSIKEKIWVYDKGTQRIVIFNKDLKVEKLVKIEKPILKPQIDSKNNFYGYELQFGFVRGKAMYTFKRLLSDFKKDEKEYFQYPFDMSLKDEKDGSSILRPYEPFSLVRIDEEGNLYYAISNQYEINKISPDGRLIKRIIKKVTPRPFKASAEKLQALKEWAFPGGKALFKYKFVFPKFYPYICNFFVLDNNFLLVLTYDNDDKNDNSIAGDVFNDKGIFLSKVEIPIYLNPYFSEAGIKRYDNSIYKKGFFYTKNFDYISGKVFIKRYKIEISGNLK